MLSAAKSPLAQNAAATLAESALTKNREGAAELSKNDWVFVCVAAAFRCAEQPMIGVVERQKGVGITPLLPYNKDQ